MKVGDWLMDEHGRSLSIVRLKQHLGVREWPETGFSLTYVGNTAIFCFPAKRIEGKRAHRVMAVCPVCFKHIPVGRLQQHRKVHK